MTYNFDDKTGRRYGRLLVVSQAENGISNGGSSSVRWTCKCDCGNITESSARNLRAGNVKSCGCLGNEIRGQSSKTHGMTRTKTYRAWAHAKDRCYRANDPRFPRYGGRGITMCDRWKNSFENFLEDMGEAPQNLTLERSDRDKNYTPENCLWDTRKAQANNTRRNVVMEFHGDNLTLSQIAERSGVDYKSLWHFFSTRKLEINLALEKATKRPSSCR